MSLIEIEYQNKFGKLWRRRLLITFIYPKKYCQKWFLNRKMIYFEFPLTKKEIKENELRRKHNRRS